MISFDAETKEFVAKTITDLGKAILTVGFASYFFEKLPFNWRITVGCLGIFFLILGVVLFAYKKGAKK